MQERTLIVGDGISSRVKRALHNLLGKAAEVVPFDPNKNPDVRAAAARVEQLQSGVIPTSGRGSCGGTTRLPEGAAWRPHTGARQRERILRQAWALFEKRCAKDAWYAATRERLLDAVQDEPDAEHAAMRIAQGAKVAADEKKEWIRKNPPPPGMTTSGAEWVDAINHALNHWEEVHKATAAQAEADGAVL